MNLLSIDALTVDRGTARILDRVSLDVARGETVALVGESGAGKSTIATAIMRLLGDARISGSIALADAGDLLALREPDMVRLRGRRLSMIFQDAGAALNPAYTVGAQLVSAVRRNLGLGKRDAHARAVELMTQVGINDPEARLSAYPHQLSGGMQQRVMVAIALAADPDLLLADEPTSALDVTIQAQIVRLILAQTRARGAACIFVLHDLALASQACDSVVVLYAGQVVESGPVRDVLDNARHPYTRQLKSCVLEIGRDDLVAPEGTVPSHEDMPAGCRFATRCPRAQDRCWADAPPLETARGSHRFACWNPE
ncbi:peptide ABC transporter ATP-binding protein [Salipiger aestuarii]|uniref:Peptide/nickel transport system ATP-binding protein/oligopeptide transport system ATP-binding protein n=1 Tax=Salipiger aestuarii TaxID=568098 RepID=A0A327XVS9_9RHOB|nr:ABC transporter ATP-binding protein [Salipiger aestuarii]EIE49982.1 oligopeptide/dipeptide ABC transporter, ATPase subunit [Citreicella sp. 357]KAA8605615.1 peptide ABC transporter ATP-binding protein [Salipiger aestuarii]KAA8608238.1 peptide ABC transporter ATP-binding protein [Salipiger aestuarii]KAB2539815.1 peptide ABC transporter ATP-binding protein [Salipiger aestuarii]RAK11996.1 peptide/nickel transport system ATP-binding protein/oligopeptide transport system ATP-binding protein [Sal